MHYYKLEAVIQTGPHENNGEVTADEIKELLIREIESEIYNVSVKSVTIVEVKEND